MTVILGASSWRSLMWTKLCFNARIVIGTYANTSPMFETAELNRSIPKAEYDKREPALRTELLELQTQLRGEKFPVLILVNGVDGSGKGDAVNLLYEWMDPRYLRSYVAGPPNDEAAARPDRKSVV